MRIRATHIPVGEDQEQHLEFARECAHGFNAIYGPVLAKPETMLCMLYLLRKTGLTDTL